MQFTFEHYQQSADYLRSKIGALAPKVMLVLGSGLGHSFDHVENPVIVPYEEIPHFMRSTAPGHAGRLIFGTLEGQDVAIMQGRFHHYEGYTFEEVTFAVRALRLLGVDTLVVTNAAGCVNTEWKAGDLMIIEDHIKLVLDSPLCGPNMDEFGPRFPDSSYNYTPALRQIAHEAAAELNIPVRKGVYMYMPGPQYETPAEIRAARILGADAVGMSTVPEVIVARHCGMQVLGVTLLTNMAAGILDQPLTEEEVLTAGEAGKAQFAALIRGCLRRF